MRRASARCRSPASPASPARPRWCRRACTRSMNAAASGFARRERLRDRMIRRDRDEARAEDRVGPRREDLDRRRRRDSAKRNRSPWLCRSSSPASAGPCRASARASPSPSSSSSAKSVIFRNHWLSLRFSTSAPDRQPRPSITCSLASTVMSTGSQLTARFLAIDQPRREQVEEQRLFVPVIIGLAGRQLAGPVEREAQPLQLRLHRRDVGARPAAGMDALLHRGVLGGHAERVPAHRVEHLMPRHPPDSARARRPSCSCGRAPCGCAPTDRGTSRARSSCGLGDCVVGGEGAALVPHLCQCGVRLQRVEARRVMVETPLAGDGRAAQVAGAGQDDVLQLLRRSPPGPARRPTGRPG